MASNNWIKLEKTTPDKPEVAILARLLNCSQGDAFLNLARVYIWADGITDDGFVPFLSPENGDSLARCCPGTFAALSSPEIGWLSYDAGGLTFANWGRHNGKCSKQRAYEAEKKTRQREMSRKCPQKTGTKPGLDKSRVDKSITPIVPKVTLRDGYCSCFEVWWLTYPRREAKRKAYEAWTKAGRAIMGAKGVPKSDAAAWLQDRTAAYAASPRATQSDAKMIPHPATWLNGGRYDDDPTAWATPLTDRREDHQPQQTTELPFLE